MKRGFTLTEMLTTIAIIGLLVGILFPSLVATREKARQAVCMSNLQRIGVGLANYSAANDWQLPPFAFSDMAKLDLPLSGQWGGCKSAMFRQGVENVNLWALVVAGMVYQPALTCPSASQAARNSLAKCFSANSQLSTYCMRFPYSRDLFRECPNLANFGKRPLDVYAPYGGGQRFQLNGKYPAEVPQVRMDRKYRLESPVTCGDGSYDPAQDAVVSDGFYSQERWSHGQRFQVLFGNGSVHARPDDGTVLANSQPPGATLPDDQACFATYAERVWQRFDANR